MLVIAHFLLEVISVHTPHCIFKNKLPTDMQGYKKRREKELGLVQKTVYKKTASDETRYINTTCLYLMSFWSKE
jgi:hypothetical protein